MHVTEHLLPQDIYFESKTCHRFLTNIPKIKRTRKDTSYKDICQVHYSCKNGNTQLNTTC